MFQIHRFGDAKGDAARLLILAGIHGDEPPGVDAAEALAKHLGQTEIHGLITVIPVVNEPARKLQSRCGPDGLDLARTFPGRSDGTATERIAAAATMLIQESTALIDLHSGGRAMEICALAGYMMVRDQAILDQQRLMASAFNLPIIWGTNDALDGRTLSIARDQGIPAIYAEYGSAKSCDAITDAYVDGCLAVAMELGLIDRRESQPRQPPLVVEETAPDSGHLQICHPSPCSGRFEAGIGLGDNVVTGQPIGTVQSEIGERFAVAAEKTGKLIARRADPEVRVGDSLGVVLATGNADAQDQTGT